MESFRLRSLPVEHRILVLAPAFQSSRAIMHVAARWSGDTSLSCSTTIRSKTTSAGHYYIGHNYIGHNYIGHNYGPFEDDFGRPSNPRHSAYARGLPHYAPNAAGLPRGNYEDTCRGCTDLFFSQISRSMPTGDRRGPAADLKLPNRSSSSRPFLCHPAPSVPTGVRASACSRKKNCAPVAALRRAHDWVGAAAALEAGAAFFFKKRKSRSMPTANAEGWRRSEGAQHCVTSRRFCRHLLGSVLAPRHAP